MEEKNPHVIVELGRLTASCFVLMPFAPTYQTLYDRVITPAVEAANLNCIRADEVFSKAQISHEIWKQIRACRLVLAELTGKNPNVLYELGLAHALGKPAIIITRNQEDVPFDLKALRYLYYDVDDPFWGDNLRRQITDMCKTVVEREDFGSIFESISLMGNIEIEMAEKKEPQLSPEIANIEGQWQAALKFDYDDEEYSWSLHIEQEREVIEGTLVISVVIDDQLSVIQENVTGRVKESTITFHGTSYSFLKAGTASTWILDSFEGVLDAEGESIVGTARDQDGKAEVKLRRVKKEKRKE